MKGKILTDFGDRLVEYFEAEGAEAYYFHDGKRQNKNILEIYSHGRNMSFYIKESNLTPGFWGLGPKFISEMDNSGSQWFTVLLLGSDEVGYLIPGHNIMDFIRRNVLSTAKTGDFKVHEGELSRNFLFESFEEFIARITDTGIRNIQEQVSTMPAGRLTASVGIRLSQELSSKGFDVLFDHASKRTVPRETVGKIASWFDPEYNSNTRLGFLDIAVVSRHTQKALALVEIEETTDKPKVLLGDILATLLGSGIKFQGNRDLRIGPWTTLIVIGRSRWSSHQARIRFLLKQTAEIKSKLATPNAAIGHIVIDLFHEEKH
jgi:hypothetical protein